MDIINSLQEKFGSSEIEKISNFLGEPIEKISRSIDLGLSTFLSGLVEKAKENSGVLGIMTVIKDGGHSGDILDDLSSVFSNFEKMKLLVTIGNNINAHFFGNDLNKVSEKLANICDIKKTSAASLFSLAAPVILGFVGKKVRQERMDVGALRHLLGDQESHLQSKLPPALLNIFSNGFTKPVEIKPAAHGSASVETKSEKPKVEKVKKEKTTNSTSLSWLAWVFLIFLTLAALYNFRSCQKAETLSNNAIVEEADTLGLPNQIDIFESENDTKSIDSTADNTLKLEENLPEAIIPKQPIEKEKEVVLTPKAVEIPVGPKKIIEKPKPAEVKKEPTVVKKENAPVVSKRNSYTSSTNWQAVSGLNFDGNTADIRNRSAIQPLIDYLKKNPSHDVEISGTSDNSRLAEDRAYALREALFENGIDESRLSVRSGKISGEAEVIVKIK